MAGRRLPTLEDIEKFVKESGPVDKGKFGKVYKLVFDSHTFAVKEIDLRNQRKDYVDRERTILQGIRDDSTRSAYIVPFLGDYRNDTCPKVYLLFDWLDANLSTIIQPPLGYPFAVYQRVLKELALAIQYLHANNIVHRDLKPKNILLTDRNLEVATVKLADFGLSKTLRPDDRHTKGVGTPLYASPEILNSIATYDCKVDIWSYGVVAYELLAKTLPFPAREKAHLKALLEGPVPVGGSQFPSGFEAICQDFTEFCLVKEELSRPAIDAVLKHPFFQVTPSVWSARDLILEADTLRDKMQHFLQLLHRASRDSPVLTDLAAVLYQELELTCSSAAQSLSSETEETEEVIARLATWRSSRG